MSDRPILFSAPMIRALLDGRKTQTRRILKPQPSQPIDSICHEGRRWWTADSLSGAVHENLHVPYAVGDRLWVRERVYGDQMENFLTGDRTTTATVGYYYADDAEVLDPHRFNLGWTWSKRSLPSIHMPRGFSRLTLIVERVRIERLHEISAADVTAEGVDGGQQHFQRLWDSINAPGAWAANPWVAAISFRVVHANIGALPAESGAHR